MAMTMRHPHILMSNGHRRTQTLASDSRIILQPSGKYVDEGIKCSPAEITRIYRHLADVRFRLYPSLGPQAVPTPLWSLQMTFIRSELERVGPACRLKWICTNCSSVLHQTRGKRLLMKHNPSMLKPSTGICSIHHI